MGRRKVKVKEKELQKKQNAELQQNQNQLLTSISQEKSSLTSFPVSLSKQVRKQAMAKSHF
uniref:Uncharacterized protein n=1 Tax=Solanum lycopersicum TaxID=4081 RepID=A0A3Q7F254_SOLLC